jgi:uncharacterized membrane protein YphA (DoxX/SURF4 family)
MAGIDILNQFPNSKMAAAAQLGQSRFRSVESTSAITPAQKTGSATLTGVAGNTSTAQLLTLCGLTTSFSEIMLIITTSVAGVVIAQGGSSTRYPQGQSATFNDVSLTANQLQVGTVAGDVVTINYVGV